MNDPHGHRRRRPGDHHESEEDPDSTRLVNTFHFRSIFPLIMITLSDLDVESGMREDSSDAWVHAWSHASLPRLSLPFGIRSPAFFS